MRTQQEVLNALTYHQVTPEKQEIMSHVRGIVTQSALTILEHCPERPERTIALRKIEEALFYAIAALARP